MFHFLVIIPDAAGMDNVPTSARFWLVKMVQYFLHPKDVSSLLILIEQRKKLQGLLILFLLVALTPKAARSWPFPGRFCVSNFLFMFLLLWNSFSTSPKVGRLVCVGMGVGMGVSFMLFALSLSEQLISHQVQLWVYSPSQGIYQTIVEV